MDIMETRWDKLLKIRTSGRDDSRSDHFRYPYEPTPYCVLERLANSGYITRQNTVVDYGCGKGRVDFFLSYQTRCHAIGVEYDPRIYETAVNNQKDAVSAGRTEFVCMKAEDYELPASADRLFFFNPFAVEILQSVMREIVGSVYDQPREVYLFFYYPSDEYIGYLMTVGEVEFVDEIDCRDLFPGDDPRERVVIFQVL